MNYTWHEEKAEEVRRKHAIEFAKITDIFSDPFAVEFADEKHSAAEDELHFITARLAENWMVKEYEENRKRY